MFFCQELQVVQPLDHHHPFICTHKKNKKGNLFFFDSLLFGNEMNSQAGHLKIFFRPVEMVSDFVTCCQVFKKKTRFF